ncbi:hypothetical protein AMATHDRAFT_10486 [Amanita thiersii Skay4041]|uniref:Uncharacterized protein n=1 Tax=Amanita thiersii Skay4041 TaxID=703135 RepID=A0A2A9N6R2_9AGAR|nr:hypothetical protein AMATHDRAFT_10486 [Amanita thiersii Skay4041]
MVTSNNCLDICQSKFPDINPTVLTSTVIECADRIGKREYFTNKIRHLARSKDSKVLQDFADKRLRLLLQEVTPSFTNTNNTEQIQDSNMEDVTPTLTKTELIRKSTAIWKDTATTMWKENIVTCNQSTLDQATRLLLLEDTSHKYAQLPENQIFDTEVDCQDMIIARIMELNTNVASTISNIRKKSTHAANQNKINLIMQQGWTMAKQAILRNPSKYIPNNIPSKQQVKILDSIVDDLKINDNHEWAHKIFKDIKNKGLQSKAAEHHIQTIICKLNSWTPPSPSPIPQDLNDQDMPLMDPIPWIETDEYKQNRKLWMDMVSEIFEKILPYFPADERNSKEELYCEAADICAAQDKSLLQLQSLSSLTDSNKHRELEEMRKIQIDKEYQSLLQASRRQTLTWKKQDFEDYLASKDFKYYVQHTKDQLSNPAVSSKKKTTLKNLIREAETTKWMPKHKIDDDGAALPDSPPPSPPPKPKPCREDDNSNTQQLVK